MADDFNIEMISFEIISNVGMARSCYIEAIDFAIEHKIDEAEAKVAEGREYYLKGHEAHAKLVQREAAGGHVEIGLLLIHAEDQLMSAETFQILSEKFIKQAKLSQ